MRHDIAQLREAGVDEVALQNPRQTSVPESIVIGELHRLAEIGEAEWAGAHATALTRRKGRCLPDLAVQCSLLLQLPTIDTVGNRFRAIAFR